jgi:flagellar basal-body rod protein FlgC
VGAVGPFSGLGIPASAMMVHRTWLDAISDNIANVNTMRRTDEAAFQARYVVAESSGGSDGSIGDGTRIAGVRWGDPEGRIRYDPDHPQADERGYVRAPDFELSDQMAAMLIAQRAYQANLGVFERQRDSYQRMLEIGRG